MKEILSFAILAIMLQGCIEKTKTNLELIKEIDSLKEKRIIYEFQVDSTGALIDTLSIEKSKINKNQVIVFKEKIINKEHLKSTNYYRDNGDLFYSKNESSELGILSTSEFWKKNNEISKGLYLGYRDNKIKDTININYEYFYNDNGLKKKTIVTSKFKDEDEIGNTTELFYSNGEKLTSEISIEYGDTLKVNKYIYTKNLIKKKTIKDYKNGVFVNLDYNEKGYIISKKVFLQQMDSLLEVSETQFITDEKGQIIKSIQTQLPSNNKIYIEFKYN
ncbi:hypothetical protein [Flavivirga sp. 57AJ16]|uniref:hypothetical protein n=1 Tax=Flavivirga sp. 57AJ16 TaxID=3025307 RepID=UPI0023654858|nr:hypothetical protein [Flavivirga sp. 57AJ16]MDD7887087.1 hypothetical protein [Flavivirga sp. 57AJ16]